MASDSEPKNLFSLLTPTSLQKSYLEGREQNLLALQFQYIVTLANCNKTSIMKSSADSLARNKIRADWWEAPLWWEAWGPGLLPLNPTLVTPSLPFRSH